MIDLLACPLTQLVSMSQILTSDHTIFFSIYHHLPIELSLQNFLFLSSFGTVVPLNQTFRGLPLEEREAGERSIRNISNV